jgi:hypothetical protein
MAILEMVNLKGVKLDVANLKVVNLHGFNLKLVHMGVDDLKGDMIEAVLVPID